MWWGRIAGTEAQTWGRNAAEEVRAQWPLSAAVLWQRVTMQRWFLAGDFPLARL